MPPARPFALADGFDADRHSWQAILCYHFLTTLTANAVVCTAAVLLWSTIGIGGTTFRLLEDYWWLALPLGALCAILLVGLYILDFFFPPHFNQVLALWPGDRIVGRTILGVAVALFVAAVLFLTSYFPSLPLLISIVLCPLAVFGAHVLYDPFALKEPKRQRSDIVNSDDMEAKEQLLNRIAGEESCVILYYKACIGTFVCGLVGNIVVFIIGTVDMAPSLDELAAGLSQEERDKKYMQWLVPLVLAISNLVFGFFVVLRVLVQPTYSHTDTNKNKIIADLLEHCLFMDLKERKTEILRRVKPAHIIVLERVERVEDVQCARQQYLEQHTAKVRELLTIIKVVVFFFLVMLGLSFCARQLLFACTHIASMIAGTVAFFFVGFCVSTYVSLWRVAIAMRRWMREMHTWKTMHSLLENDWVKAALMCLLIPFVPVVVLLSYLNQAVRKRRSLYGRPDLVPRGNGSSLLSAIPSSPLDSPGKQGQEEPRPEDSLLTPRVGRRITQMRSWNWLTITPRIHVLCLLYMAYTICLPLLTVGLAWLNKVIDQANISYPVVLLAIFVVGMILFILPTPGAAIYVFGGVVSAGQCPPKGTDQGFWTGAFVSILLGLVMKLFGCTIQQVIIGGLMGKSRYVRQTAGVHKVGIRCMEHVLRQKGYTAGKLAILCGGPDWPTSVFAGMLGLSLREMLMGTLPIIVLIIPMGLTGSLYLKKGEGGMWENLPSLFLVLSLMVNAALYAIAGWAMQQAFEKHQDELSRPLEQNVDLGWLDYRADYVKKRLQLQWTDLPKALRGVWLMGGCVQVFVCSAFLVAGGYLVGNFQVSDDIDSLSVIAGWDASDGLLTYPCLALLCIYTAAWFGHISVTLWQCWMQGRPRREAQKDADRMEAAWKEAYLRLCSGQEAGATLTTTETEETSATPPPSIVEETCATRTASETEETGPSGSPSEEKRPEADDWFSTAGVSKELWGLPGDAQVDVSPARASEDI
uniref:Uncharacterized protein n=1 Tax=Alexandrium monilatum TaxID=311494 RepID=A0A7S4UYS3_9DINO